MKNLIFTLIIMSISMSLYAQKNDTISNNYLNTADKMLMNKPGLTIGGYAQIDYNQDLSSEKYNTGNLDVHRLVMLLGYNFNEKLKFVSEIEYEHVKEVYVEQAFLQYKANNFMNFRAGLVLIPMGILNEYHEPPTFNGVERTLVDKYIVPTTWREVGFGLTGNIIDASIKYQAYIVNGFNGFDGSAHLSGNNGLRKGRQKGAESFVSAPNFTGKVEYYGIRGLNLGLSGYFGKTQTTAYNGIEKSDSDAIKSADSTVVGISMIGLDARYQLKGFAFRGQITYTTLSNTEMYNQKLATDVGSSMIGYYAEIAYDVFRPFNNIKSQLMPFVRYEFYDTQNSVSGNTIKNKDFNNTIITTGIGWKITPKVAVKSDMQFYKTGSKDKYSTIFNAGVGVMF